MEKKRYYKKNGGEAHLGWEWDFDKSSTDSSSDEDAANITVNKGLLFPNVDHKCPMAKDRKKKKVHSRDTPKYTTSDDEGSSSENDDDLTSPFANLTMDQKKKINELIKPLKRRMRSWNAKRTCSIRKIKSLLREKMLVLLKLKNMKTYLESLIFAIISCIITENVSLIATIKELNACKPSKHLLLSMLPFALDVEMLMLVLSMITLL
jgi:hypothetical protein